MKTLIKETQRNNQWWIWLLLIAMNGFWLYAVVRQVFMGDVLGNNPAPDAVLLGFGLIPIALLVLFFIMRLEIEICENGIYYRYLPFISKKQFISKEEIVQWEVGEYKPIKEYGGWGIRPKWKGQKGMALNVKGNMGIRLQLSNGKVLVLGTQQPDVMRRAIEQMFSI